MRFIAQYVGIAIVAFLATYITLSSDLGAQLLKSLRGEQGTTAELVLFNPCPAEHASSFSCWETYYADVMHKYGSHVALMDLKDRYTRGGYPRLYCHTLLHPIGKKAAQEYGSVAEAYTHNDPFCRSGYFHGVLEGIFGEKDDGGGEALLSKLDSLCSSVKGKERYSYDYFACVHGVGHGLMAFFDHNVFQSLSGCDLFTGTWEQSSCYGGVFMENVISDSPEEPSKFLKDDDVLYPCNAVEGKYQEECYQMQTSHMLSKLNGDFARTFELCASIEEKNRIYCYQSIGRDASGWSYGSAEAALEFCATGKKPEQRTECIVGAAADFIQSVSIQEARDVCARAPEESRMRCVENVESQARML